jgi:hypothetical protein
MVFRALRPTRRNLGALGAAGPSGSQVDGKDDAHDRDRMPRSARVVRCRVAAGAPASAQQPKPNILFILADNIGYGNIGAYGGGELRGAPTPRIESAAIGG